MTNEPENYVFTDPESPQRSAALKTVVILAPRRCGVYRDIMQTGDSNELAVTVMEEGSTLVDCKASKANKHPYEYCHDCGLYGHFRIINQKEVEVLTRIPSPTSSKSGL